MTAKKSSPIAPHQQPDLKPDKPVPHKQLEETLPEESQQLFYEIFHSSPTAIAISRLSDGRFVQANQSFLDLTGYTLDEVIGLTSVQAGITSDFQARESRLAALQQNGRLPSFEVDVTRKSGEARQGLATSATIVIAGEEFALSTFIDITERKRAERQVVQMKRLYATLSQVNQMIARVREQGDLFQSICDVAVQFGEFSLAWVGLLDEASGDIKPVAANGLNVAQWPFPVVNIHQGAFKDTLAASAIRAVRVVTSEDVQTDERSQPSRAAIQQFSYRASAAVPFRLRGKTIGVICLVSSEVGLFKAKDEVHLLDEIGLDISFALDTLETSAEHKKAEAAREQLARIVDSSEDAILSKTLNGVVTSWNRGAERLYGYSAQEAIGKSVALIIPPDRPNELPEIIQRIQHGEYIEHYETLRARKDGKKIWVSITVSPILNSAGAIVGVASIARDISERKHAAGQLLQMKRLYATLSQVNQMIVRVRERDDLFQSICDVAVQFGEFPLAWVGLLDEASGDVRPVMANGLDVTQWPFPVSNIHRGDFKDGLVATAVRTARVTTSEDIQTDERVQTVHEKSRQTSFHAAAALPLQVKGRTIGALCLISHEVGLFNAEDEVRLLKEMGGDISFALEMMETEQERKEAEERLEKSEQRFRTAFDTMLEGAQILGFDWRYLYLNQAAEIHNRRPNQELLGKTYMEMWPGIESTPLFAALKQCMEQRISCQFESEFVYPDGAVGWFELAIQPIPEGVFILSVDITERKRAEIALKASETNYRSLAENSESAIAVLDRDGCIRYANAWGMKTWDDPQIVGKTIFDIYPRKYARRYSAAIRRVIDTQTSIADEVESWVNGRRMWFRLSMSPLKNPDGTVTTLLLNAWDITESKQAEQEVLKSKLKLEAALASMTDAVFMSDNEGRFLDFNEAFATFHKFRNKEECVATFDAYLEILDVFLPNGEAAPVEQWAVSRALRGETGVNVEYFLRRKDTGESWIGSYNFAPIRDQAGLIAGSVVTARDVTAQKMAEEKLRASEERYRGLFEHMAEGYAYCQMIYEDGQAQDWIYLSVNAAFENLAGLKDATGKRVSDLIPGIRASDPQLFEIYARVALGGQPEKFEAFVVALQKWFSVSVYCPKREFFVAVFDVITERKQAEEALKASEKKYRLISENSADVIWTLDLATKRFTYVSPSVFRLSGLMPEELMAQPMQAAITPESAQKIEQILPVHITAFLSGDQSARTAVTEVNQLHKDGSIIPTEVVTTLITGPDGQVVEVLGVSRDITERKRAEEALLKNEGQMRALVTSLDDIVFEFDEQGTYLNVWTADESLLTLPKTQLLGRSITEISGEENGRPFAAAIKRVVTNRRSERLEYPLNVIGGLHWFLATISPVIAQDHSCHSASMLIRDITERKQAEEKIRNQLERLKTLRDIDAVISSSFDMKLSLDVIVSRTISELNVDAADVLVLDSTAMVLEYRAGQGFRSKAFQNDELRVGEGIVGHCVFERKPVHIRDLRAREDVFIRRTSLNEEKFIGYYCVPLIDKGEVKGVLEIFHRSLLEPEQEWIDFLHTLAGQAAIAIESASLFDGLQRSNAELGLAYDQTIEGWSRALDLRDKETEGHTLRVTDLTVQLARAYGFNGEELQHIRRGALLHDIGKLGVPDDVLFKPGPLTDVEWDKMRKHPQFAYNLIAPIRYLKPALDIPYCHHEKWDGTGYPRALMGDLIPLAARLFTVVDVWDALRNDRPYRAGWPEEKVIEHIRALAGTHFDPKCVELFLRVISKKTNE